MSDDVEKYKHSKINQFFITTISHSHQKDDSSRIRNLRRSPVWLYFGHLHYITSNNKRIKLSEEYYCTECLKNAKNARGSQQQSDDEEDQNSFKEYVLSSYFTVLTEVLKIKVYAYCILYITVLMFIDYFRFPVLFLSITKTILVREI